MIDTCRRKKGWKNVGSSLAIELCSAWFDIHRKIYDYQSWHGFDVEFFNMVLGQKYGRESELISVTKSLNLFLRNCNRFLCLNHFKLIFTTLTNCKHRTRHKKKDPSTLIDTLKALFARSRTETATKDRYLIVCLQLRSSEQKHHLYHESQKWAKTFKYSSTIICFQNFRHSQSHWWMAKSVFIIILKA